MTDSKLDPGQHPATFNAAAQGPSPKISAPATPAMHFRPEGSVVEASHQDVTAQEQKDASKSHAQPLTPMTADAFAKMVDTSREQSQGQGIGD